MEESGVKDSGKQNELGYEHTLMYGRYTKDLGDFAKSQAERVKQREKLKRKEGTLVHGFHHYKDSRFAKVYANVAVCWHFTFARLGEDWIYLAVLGVLMALLSFAMDYAISMCQKARIWLYQDLVKHQGLQFLSWTMFPVLLIIFSSGFVHLVAPQAIGSGIPEMKTILRGVVLKEYLTFRTLLSKMIGLTTSLGSGMPLGKEGPFVHIASIVATLLSKLVTSFKGIYENESRNSEMLAAACAVGVACSFAAPIGGVLFSIEVTSVYFAVRNYWRGFFAAVCGAMVFRLLAVWFKDEETLTALFRTSFRVDFPFDPQELVAFAMIGVFCGFAGSLFVWSHRQFVNFNRRHKKLNYFLQKNRFIYPSIVSFIVSAVTFPHGLGQFMAADLNTHTAMNELFSNITWSGEHLEGDEFNIISHWKTESTNIYVNLVIFIIMNFVLTILAMTLPVPAGVFIPIFKIGAAFGRLVGECMASWFPDGIRVGGEVTKILPGGYAVVGAAALSGSVTHTISTSVIVFELTGQIAHIIPVMIAVLIANAIAQSLQPSIYDSIILIKKLPYLPDIVTSSTGAYNTYVEDIMIRDVYYIYHGASYKELKQLLKAAKMLSSFPLVDSPDSMILLGSIQRVELLHILEQHIGKEKRLQVATKRAEEAEAENIFRYESDQGVTETSSPIKSRFAVTKVPDVSVNIIDENGTPQPSSSMLNANFPSSLSPCTTPKKSILKKTGYSPSPMTSPYSTITSQDSKLRLAFENIFKKANTLRDVDDPVQSTVQSISSYKRVTLPRERVIDMSHEEQLEWEDGELESEIDFTNCHVDPAPFQLVERTSLLKVHSLFSMLGLNRAYVTAIGRLVGVVALKEVRKAIEGAHGSNTVDAKPSKSLNYSESTDTFPNNSTLLSYPDSNGKNGLNINLNESDIELINSDDGLSRSSQL